MRPFFTLKLIGLLALIAFSFLFLMFSTKIAFAAVKKPCTLEIAVSENVGWSGILKNDAELIAKDPATCEAFNKQLSQLPNSENASVVLSYVKPLRDSKGNTTANIEVGYKLTYGSETEKVEQSKMFFATMRPRWLRNGSRYFVEL